MAKVFLVDSGATLTTSLLGYWKLEDVTEFFVENQDFVNNNSVAFTEGRAINASDGGSSNTNKSLSTTGTLGINGTTVSMGLWINLTTGLSSGTYTFIDQNNNSTQTGYTVRYEFNGGSRRIQWTRQRLGVSDDQVNETVNLTSGTWYNLILTYDGSNVEGWRDGVSKGTAASTGNGSANGVTGISILSHRTSVNFTSGKVDELGIWRKKLANAEISDLYNSGAANTMVNTPISDAKNIMIVQSLCKNNTGDGVNISNVSGVLVEGTKTSNNTGVGIKVASTSLLTRILGNFNEGNSGGNIVDNGVATVKDNNITI